MKRTAAESDLDFIGFIIFENKLKPTTSGVLQVLEKANIRKLMCTGDNILTAISVARECTLIDKYAHCFVPHFVEGKRRLLYVILEPSTLMDAGHSKDPESRLVWESIDNPIYQLDDRTLIVCLPQKHNVFVLITCSRCLR
jgi:cation-transporting ATPase 13A2